jgi:cell division protein FtsN
MPKFAGIMKRFIAPTATNPPPAPALPGFTQQMKRPRLTPAQSKAIKAYNYALQQEDRYLGSVFVTAQGQRAAEERTKAAYTACKALGMDHTHGL